VQAKKEPSAIPIARTAPVCIPQESNRFAKLPGVYSLKWPADSVIITRERIVGWHITIRRPYARNAATPDNKKTLYRSEYFRVVRRKKQRRNAATRWAWSRIIVDEKPSLGPARHLQQPFDSVAGRQLKRNRVKHLPGYAVSASDFNVVVRAARPLSASTPSR